MVETRAKIRAIAQTRADVLIIGETGTGKEVAARALHRASNRSDKPFVAINCAALPSELVESELFGHEAGAFPGATRARYGKFEHARGGTVFLDEIDSLELALQAKLLHAIENREVVRLGSNDTIQLDVRFVAASKSDLEAAAGEGSFRSDLLYRLNVATIQMPTLDQRREDIPRLFAHLVNQAGLRDQRQAPEIPNSVFNQVSSRDWPGNVRELKNVADRFALGLDLDLGSSTEPSTMKPLSEQVAAYERSLIAASITAHAGSLKGTYESLGLSRRALYEKMQKYGLAREDFVDE